MGAFLESNFVASVIGTAVGAYGAHRLIERQKRREILLEEIRNVNKASTISLSVCNSLLDLKRKHTKPMYEKYSLLKDKATKLKDNGTNAKISLDLQVMHPVPLPLDALQRIVFEKLSLNGRPLALMAGMMQNARSLEEFMDMRNKIIYACMKEPSGKKRREMYFGFPDEDENIDNTYSSCLDVIRANVDNIIKFSEMLTLDLLKHGDRQYQSFENKFGKGAPKINRFNWDNAANEGLIPDDKNYAVWTTAFRPHKEKTRWQLFKSKLLT